MAFDAHERDERSPTSLATEKEAEILSLSVYVHSDGDHCIASFCGALSSATRTTIYAVSELLVGERSVVFDFSRADVPDESGEDAVEVLIQSVRERGTDVQIAQLTISNGSLSNDSLFNGRPTVGSSAHAKREPIDGVAVDDFGGPS